MISVNSIITVLKKCFPSHRALYALVYEGWKLQNVIDENCGDENAREWKTKLPFII